MRILRKLWSFLCFIALVLCIAGALSLAFAVGRQAYQTVTGGKLLIEESQSGPTDRLARMGQQGDFFGGHLAAILSAATLALVILTTYFQNRVSNLANARAMFASGIDTIAQYDTKEAASPQALRLLDHYSALALKYDRNEFYSLLHTVMTSRLRGALRKPNCTYEYAVRVRRLNSLRTVRRQLQKKNGWLKGSYRYYSGQFRQ